jgi:BioD-like phosphotransacetylase family protein
MALKSLYIVGTKKDVGKTTMSLGLLHAFRKKGLRAGYMKPLGQRVVPLEGLMLHEDSRVVASLIGSGNVEQMDMAVPLTRGKVEQQVYDFKPAKVLEKAVAMYESLVRRYDLVVIEGMGHVAMGSCVGVSAADVCRAVGAKALLVSEGGIGKAIDDIFLCSTFLNARGVPLTGAIVNKVWPEKFTRIKEATTLGLKNLGLRSFGTVPFQDQLTSPTMADVHEQIGGEILGGGEHLSHRVRQTIIGAMDAQHMIRYIGGGTLVIIPGDRNDSIMAALRAHLLGDKNEPAVAGLILTGDFRPNATVVDELKNFHLPVLCVKEDTFATANKIINTVFKITPNDRERIEWAVCLAAEYLDVDGILSCLENNA